MAERSADKLPGFCRDRGDVVITGDRSHQGGIHRLDHDIVAELANDNVAGEEHTDLGIDLEGSARKPWIAGPDDHVGIDVLVDLCLERCLHVDFGECSEADAGKGGLHFLDGFLEGAGQNGSFFEDHADSVLDTLRSRRGHKVTIVLEAIHPRPRVRLIVVGAILLEVDAVSDSSSAGPAI